MRRSLRERATLQRPGFEPFDADLVIGILENCDD
jgi:hypothetical protein